jgi:hypothetical protein
MYSTDSKNNAGDNNPFSHIDGVSNVPTMVDVSEKQPTKRTAHARAVVKLPLEVAKHFDKGDINTPKGPVFTTAIIAGTMACEYSLLVVSFYFENKRGCWVDELETFQFKSYFKIQVNSTLNWSIPISEFCNLLAISLK